MFYRFAFQFLSWKMPFFSFLFINNQGRQGRGSIFVFAAGNGGREFDNCAYNGYANSVFTITITGVDRNGSIPEYAERCSAIMASSYSQDNVGTGVDSIVSSLVNHPVRYLAVSQLVTGQYVEMEASLDICSPLRCSAIMFQLELILS